MVQTNNTGDGDGSDEVDSDSDYEEEPAISPTKLRTGDSVQEDNVPGQKFLPGAFVT